ncbi:hypothetical protein PUNSTDRAFT_141512 [Punctularia strigosozonata HHB-11173 SS5]|uniref:uncharacterized protein n=1 Tax=Punctularia strigosozonata (strain HHB-11173) TaxID=741275 RepID=UPI0004416EE9|nr:uncharacterized protein PUNSTDRAFT_141512 [Punctularia strigosozonata HHB-11173 SS5]EIN12963.1 hypothetical protein PUNSTDRAFT_141512 [Punctularia strigosozonata HHB-11173 SS5]
MSTRRNASAGGASSSKDVVMGPPPVPQAPPPTTDPHQAKEEALVAEKYRRLKRKYSILEEKYKEMHSELVRSGERNVKIRQERDALLDRVVELEKLETPGIRRPSLGPDQPPTSAFPRSLLSDRAKTAFVANMHRAREEVERENHELDPIFSSRHIGPHARKLQEQQRQRERMQEEAAAAQAARDAKPSRRAKMTKGKDKDAPPPSSSSYSAGQAQGSGSGIKLRIKPPTAPASEPPEPASPPPDSHEYSRMSRNMSSSPVTSYHPSPPHRHNGNASDANDPYLSPVEQRSIGAEEPKTRTKPKRLKAHTVTSKTHTIPTIPRDSDGKPLLPLNVGIMTVLSLGEVCMREHFHTERYIFPVGYSVTRKYLSTIDPNIEVTYTCTILDGGDGPKFSVVASDVPDKPIVAGTATGAWAVIVRAANHVRKRLHSNSVSGPDFFGLGQNTIRSLIQELPNADRLKDYVWQNFTEGSHLGGRHAAVTPALPEDRDEIAASQNLPPVFASEREREREQELALARERERQMDREQTDEDADRAPARRTNERRSRKHVEEIPGSSPSLGNYYRPSDAHIPTPSNTPAADPSSANGRRYYKQDSTSPPISA